jgi:uncharacterized membrane protein YhaH (DUF805 family)
MGPLLGQIVIAILGAARPRRKMRHWPLVLFALLFALLSVVFLCGAAFFALVPSLGPAAAAAVVAVALLLLAAIMMLCAVLAKRRHPAAPSADPALLNTVLQQFLEKSDQSDKLPIFTIIALLLGLAVSYSPTLREFLRSMTEESSD